jgi:uncharacterized membrane protein
MGCAAILVLALALRVYRLGAQEFWVDETFSFHDATAEHWLADLRLRDMPPLYTVLLHNWMGVAGIGEAGLRLLSAILGTLAVAATMWSAREIGGRRGVVPAGLVAAAAPMQVYYSQEARPYALLLLLLAAMLGLVHRAVRRDRAGDWALVFLVATAALYTHILSAVALVGTAGMLLVEPRPRVLWRWVASLTAAALLFMPWLVWSFGAFSRSVGLVDWVADVWAKTPPSMAIPRSLELFVIGPQAGLLPIRLKQFNTLVFPAPLRWLALAAAGALAVGLVAPLGAGAAPRDRRVPALLIALFFPLVALFAISLIVKPIYIAGRYDMIGFPAFPLLVGLAWAKLEAAGPHARRIVPIAAAALAFPVAVKLARYYAEPALRPTMSAVAAGHLAASLAPDDAVIFPDLRGYVVLYQLARRSWRWNGDWCENTRAGTRVVCHLVPFPATDIALDGQPDMLRTAIGRALELRPTTVFVVHGKWAVGPEGPRILPGDGAVAEELARLGYRPVGGDWDAGISRYRRPG